MPVIVVDRGKGAERQIYATVGWFPQPQQQQRKANMTLAAQVINSFATKHVRLFAPLHTPNWEGSLRFA
eukprot:3996694-Amphidinium_carterae.1